MEQAKTFLSWFVRSFIISHRSDVKVVLLCFVAATTFWFLNALNKDYTTRLLYPIKFEYADTAYVATTELPKNIALNVSGYGWNLLRKSILPGADPLVIPINNPARTHYLTGVYLLQPVTEQLDGIRVNYIMDDTLFVSFDRLLSKTISVRVDSARIPLRENHRVVSPVSVEPASVTYKGPAAIINKLPDEIFITIPAKEIDENYDESLPVEYIDNELVTQNTNRVRVGFEVVQFVEEVQRVPVQTVNFPSQNPPSLPAPEAEVAYLVRQEDVDRARLPDFQVLADFKTFSKKDSTVKLSVVTRPDYTHDVRLVEPVVRLKYGKQD